MPAKVEKVDHSLSPSLIATKNLEQNTKSYYLRALKSTQSRWIGK